MLHVPLYTFLVSVPHLTKKHYVAAMDKKSAEDFVRNVVGVRTFTIETVCDGDGIPRITDCVLEKEGTPIINNPS